MKRWVGPVLLVIGLGTLAWWVAIQERSPLLPKAGQASLPTPSPTGRREAPDFRLTDLEGKPLQLSALRGKVVLLDFWATWCPPCRAEIPHFNELYTAYRAQGLEVIGLAMDQEGPGVVRPFVRENRVSYPIAMDDSRISRAYGPIHGIPTTFLIDRQGRIVKKFMGYQEKAVFEREIRTLLSERR